MTKRYLIAFLVSILILLGYPHYLRWIGLAPSVERGGVVKEVPEKPPLPQREEPKVPHPQAETLSFQNNLYQIQFTSRGGNVLFLAQDDTSFYKATPQEKGIFGVKILYEGEDLTQALFKKVPFEAPRFVYESPGQYRLTKTYFVGREKPTFILELELENLSDREKHFPLVLEYALDPKASGAHEEGMVKAVSYTGERLGATSLPALRKKPLLSTEPTEWQGLVQKYDALLVKPDWKIVSHQTRFESGRLVSEIKFTPLSVRAGGTEKAHLLIYAGPKHYETLKGFDVEFEKIITHGMLGFLRMWILVGLNFFNRVAGNYGVAILLITLLIKLLFTPLTHLSYESMKKMQALQPKMKALQKQYQKDPARMNKELMELYRRNRVNPMMGCLPLVLQIPIFIAFYNVLSEAVEMKGVPFIFWIRDLSEPDRLFTLPTTLPFIGNAVNLLPLLMLGSMLWQQKLTPQAAANPMQEKMMYLMPIIFGFIFYNLPSGLVLYWLANNLLTIFHQLFIKRIPVILHHEDRDHG